MPPYWPSVLVPLGGVRRSELRAATTASATVTARRRVRYSVQARRTSGPTITHPTHVSAQAHVASLSRPLRVLVVIPYDLDFFLVSQGVCHKVVSVGVLDAYGPQKPSSE